MLRVLLSTPTRLEFGGGPLSFAVLRVAPTAASTVRLVARPLASSFGRLVGCASLRALSTVVTPNATAAVTSDYAVVAPKGLRALSVDEVVDFVKGLHVSQVQADKLAMQEVDGAALLETSVDELCGRYGLSGGAAHTIMRGIAPAVTESQSVTLTIYPPKPKNKSHNITQKETLTPSEFLRMFDVLKAPLRIANSSGLVLGTAKTLAQAVDASSKGLRLLASRRYDDDLTVLNGFKDNSAKALEIKSTRALSNDTRLLEEYGPLELVNSGEELELHLPHVGEDLKLAPDGIVVSTSASVVLFNSVKHNPSVDDVFQLISDAAKLEFMLSDFAAISTTPQVAKGQSANLLPHIFGPSKTTTLLRSRLRIVPFLSGDNFRAFVEVECEKMGVGVVRPSGEGFFVKLPCSRGREGSVPVTATSTASEAE